MKLREIMAQPVVRIHPGENVAVAARLLERSNIGCLPVCGSDGKLCGVVTDRDLVVRCLAAGKNPGTTSVREVMTRQTLAAFPDMEAREAAALMGQHQVRRLPVLENGRLCGMVSLGDLARTGEEGEALERISSNVR